MFWENRVCCGFFLPCLVCSYVWMLGLWGMGEESLVFRIGLVEGLGEGREGGGRGAGLGDGLGEGGERVVFLGGVSPSLLW